MGRVEGKGEPESGLWLEVGNENEGGLGCGNPSGAWEPCAEMSSRQFDPSQGSGSLRADDLRVGRHSHMPVPKAMDTDEGALEDGVSRKETRTLDVASGNSTV